MHPAHCSGCPLRTLPYGHGNTPLVSFCAECGQPLFSLRPRNRGENVFCDPHPDKDRSVCANRYHSRASKRLAKERRGATERKNDASGVPMKVVQEVLGHAQMSMTSDLHSHVLPELQRDAADRIGEVLFGS